MLQKNGEELYKSRILQSCSFVDFCAIKKPKQMNALALQNEK
jgi:hypothetical protein